MLDLGWSELLVIGVVALIVVGPKDLPQLFRALGRFTARARAMAREFTSAMEDAAKDSGIDEAAGTLRDVKSLTSKKNLGLDALDRAAERFEQWGPTPPRSGASAAPAPGKTASALADGKTPASAAPPSAPADTAQGQRQLRAVRRSDLTDDGEGA